MSDPPQDDLAGLEALSMDQDVLERDVSRKVSVVHDSTLFYRH
jgi:hypothetical protein